MSSRRTLKAAEAIRESVSMAILTSVNDPRVQGVTVTKVEVAPDMRSAKVHVSVMGTDTQQRLCLIGLQNSAGFLQSKLKERINTRYTPKLEFELDLGVKKSIEIASILKRVLPRDDAAEAGDESLTDDEGHDADDQPDQDESDQNDADRPADAAGSAD